MKNNLPSGAILPSGLLEAGRTSVPGFQKAYNNFDLKMGVVIAKYDIDDPRNSNGTVPEYDISVMEQNEDLGQTVSTYHNCVQNDIFGGIADYFEYAYRVQTTTNNGSSEQKDAPTQNGSLVLILCLNGSDDSAIILGGLSHPQRKTKLTKEAGLAMYAEFNGLELSVDKSGALKFLFKGATDIEGKPLDSAVGGSIMEIASDGSIRFSDGNKEAVLIDKKGKQIVIVAEKAVNITSSGTMSLTSTDKTSVKAGSFLLNSEGSASFQGSSMDFKSDGAFSVKTSNFALNSSGMVNIKGQMVTIDAPLVALGGPAGQPLLLASLQTLGIGNLGLPVLSVPIAGFSIKVLAN